MQLSEKSVQQSEKSVQQSEKSVQQSEEIRTDHREPRRARGSLQEETYK